MESRQITLKEKFKNCSTIEEVHDELEDSICHDFLHYEAHKKNFERFRTRCRLYIKRLDPDFPTADTCNAEEILQKLEKEDKYGLKTTEN